MMPTHADVRRSWLPVADAIDRWAATGSRLRLHALAALARLSEGQSPIDYIHGPALPYEVMSEGPLARVLRYPAKGTKHKTPVLVVASLINRYYVLDLLPELSVIGAMCERGFDVWVLDWKAPGELGPTLRFADYVDGAIAAAARETGAPVALLGYCMGGTLATLFAARHPEQVKSLCLLGTPIDFHASGLLASWTTRELFDADLAMDVLGNMPPSMMQSGFKLMNPVDALFKVAHLFGDAGDAFRVRHRVAMESWLEDNVAFPGGVYREYISALYQDNALLAGTFRIAGDVVDLRKLTAPLLNVIALRDHICAPPASRALMPLVGSTDQRVLEFNTGHIGLTTSQNAHTTLWPQIFDWMAARV